MKLAHYTVTLPVGTTNHSDPHLLCPPATWETVAVFFIGNYFSHAATVKLPPATSVTENIRICFIALLMPAAGLYYGLSAFSQAIRSRHKRDLGEAALAGALCMYVRTDNWKPPYRNWSFDANVKTLDDFTEQNINGLKHRPATKPPQPTSEITSEMMAVFLDLRADRSRMRIFHRMKIADRERQAIAESPLHEGLEGIELMERPTTSPDQVALLRVTHGERNPSALRNFETLNSSIEVHGLKYMHPSYELAYVPRNAVVEDILPTPARDDGIVTAPLESDCIKLSKSTNLTKGLIAILQLIFSIFTLVRSKANQIELYGYAAFSLTVAPYAVMALVNLIANAVMPTYPSLYLVRNDVMDEIESVNGVKFCNVVGTVRQVNDTAGRIHLQVGSHRENNHHYIRGIPDLPPNATARIMTPDEAVARGMLPQYLITIPPCAELENSETSSTLSLFIIILGFLLVTAPVALIGGLSSFKRGSSSTKVQRAVVMTWLASGQIFGLWMALAMQKRSLVLNGSSETFNVATTTKHRDLMTEELLQRLDIAPDAESRRRFHVRTSNYHLGKSLVLWPLWVATKIAPDLGDFFVYVYLALFYGFVAIWGFVIVGQMLLDYGNCIRVY